MSFNFPSSPTNGQLFTPVGGAVTYQFNGYSWLQAPGTMSGPRLLISDSPPLNAMHGDLWWESDSGNLYVWYDDGSSAQWVQVNMPMPGDSGGAGLTFLFKWRPESMGYMVNGGF